MSNEDENTENEEQENEEQAAVPTSWDEYVAGLPEDQKEVVTKLYEDKNKGLLNTVKATREERDTFATQLRDAAKKAEKGSEAEKLYTEQANQLEQANKRADFYESAPSHECKNPKVAFKIAMSDNLFTKKGEPDWEAIKKEAPELFGTAVEPPRKPIGRGGAGEGTDKKPVAARSMSELIREAAGAVTNLNE